MATSCIPKASSEVLNRVLETYADVFSNKGTPVGIAHVTPATINTGDTAPIRQCVYRLPQTKKDMTDQCVKEMLEDRIIRPSDSPWASPITLVQKKDGSTRFCVDYRQLNSATRKDAHLLPLIQDIFDQVARRHSLLHLGPTLGLLASSNGARLNPQDGLHMSLGPLRVCAHAVRPYQGSRHFSACHEQGTGGPSG